MIERLNDEVIELATLGWRSWLAVGGYREEHYAAGTPWRYIILSSWDCECI